MPRITEDLIRKRSEHNEYMISTLEEISLHQQDIERIEWLDKWCRDLKILYLQSNLIPKIENVGRLKKMEYLNLALNNIERVENLEGCESLKKLDFTVNFIGELTSLECLRDLYNLRDLYLTGNPCTEYEGYRDFVIATLPQITHLDGIEIEKSERIKAIQILAKNRESILQQQAIYKKNREKEKAEAEAQEKEAQNKKSKEKKPGTDWYTDTNAQNTDSDNHEEEEEELTEEEERKRYWEEKTAYTPESRVELHRKLEEQRKKDLNEKEPEPPKPRKLQTDDGQILNVNEAKVDFSLKEDVENQTMLLDIAIFKHMDTSLCDVDVQPTYVKVILKGKVLQLTLSDEVNPDKSTAKRSQITGHLLITMPKAKPIIKPAQPKLPKNKESNKENCNNRDKNQKNTHERLEVDPSKASSVDICNIVRDTATAATPLGGNFHREVIPERPNSADFEDDDDVPPLM